MLLDLLGVAGFLLFFLGVFFAAYTMFPPKEQQDIRKKLEDEDAVLGEGAQFIKIFRPFFQILMPVITRLPLQGYRAKIEKYAVTAGIEREITGDDFIGFQITTAALFTFMSLVFFKNTLVIIGAGILGIGYPYLWLYDKRKKRQEAIVASMPDVVDMLSLSVEAGLDFNSGINKVCDIYKKNKDPFVAELHLMSKATLPF